MTKHLNRMSLWDMLSLLSGDTFAAIGNLGQVSNMFYDAPSDENGRVGVKTQTLGIMIMSLGELGRIAEELNLDASMAAVSECSNVALRHTIVRDVGWFVKADIERLSWMLHNLRTSLSAQMQSRLVVVMDTPNAKFVTEKLPPFGNEVDDAFPKAAEEISEAAKCLAFQRNTACVFHLMRAMERAVARLAEAIGTGKPTEKEWGKILADIGQAIEAMPKGERRDQWSESHSHLYHVKQAWRNDTMHPKRTYTDEQAQNVFNAVRSFMQHLAPLVA